MHYVPPSARQFLPDDHYDEHGHHHDAPHDHGSAPLYFMTAMLGVLIVVSVAIGWFGETLLGSSAGLWSSRLVLAAAFLGGLRILYQSLEALFEGTIGADLALAIATVAAIILGEPLVAAEVVFIAMVGECLEAITFGRAQREIRKILELTPRVAHVLRDGQMVDLPLGEVAVGDTILVRPGERVPVDGVVLTGQSAIDQSALTGESLPVDKEADDEVFTGTLNQFGALEIETQKIGSQTTLGQVIKLVAEATQRKAPLERTADRYARYFLPAVLLLATATHLLNNWSVPAGEWNWMPTLAVLVVACPCPLILATPAAVMAAMAWLASRGVVIKGGIALERLATVTSLAFDKTGTLTEGRLTLGEVRVLAPMAGGVFGGRERAESDPFPPGGGGLGWGAPGAQASPPPQPSPIEGEGAARRFPVEQSEVAANELVRLAAAAEQRSEHLLAQLIVREAGKRNLVVPVVEHFTAHPGAGVTAQLPATSISAEETTPVDGNHMVVVGNRRHLESEGIAMGEAAEETLAEFDASGHTPLLVALNGRLIGVLGVRDTIRPEARDVLAELKQLGISEIALLTGDRRSTAEAVAREVGSIDHVEAELLPIEKAEWVTRQQQHSVKVGMIGDGVNDAPALASADVGLALGGVGSDIAAEAGDLVLMGDPLAPLPGLIRLSRQTVRVIRQNIIVFAFMVNGTAVFLAAWGFLSPVGAAVFHQIGSLAVLLNAMRLLWFERWNETWIGRQVSGVAALADSVAEALSPNRGIHWVLHHWRGVLRGLVAFGVLGFLGWNVTLVGPDEQAVVTRFGRFQAPLGPGLYWRLPPPLERVYKEKTQLVRNLEIGYRMRTIDETQSAWPWGRAGSEPTGEALARRAPIEWDDTHLDASYERREEEALVLTGDEQLVEVTAVVQYRIGDLRTYLFDAERPVETLRAVAESALRAVCSEQSLAGILTSARPAIESEVRRRVAQRSDAYRLGIEVVAVGLHDVHPPLAVVGDYRDVASALEDRQRMINDAEADYLQEVLLAAGEQAVGILSALRSSANGEMMLTDEIWRTLKPVLAGTAKADLLDAERDRLGRIERAGGEADRFMQRLAAFLASPWVTHVRLYWQAMEQGLSDSRLVIVDPKAAGRRHLLFADPELAGFNALGPQPIPQSEPAEEH